MNNHWKTNLGASWSILRRFAGSVGILPERELVIRMLLEEADLPSDHSWSVVYESSHRSGAGSTIRKSDALRRARKVKGVGADRRFRDAEGMKSIMSSVSTFASTEDAVSRVPLLPENIVRPPLGGFTIVSSRVVSEHEITAVPAPLVYEESFVGPNGPGTTRVVSGNVATRIFAVWCSARADPWDWTIVNSLATKQVDRIRKVLAEGD
jgi:hypothetical protein